MQFLLKYYDWIFDKWIQIPQKIRFLLVGSWNALFSYILYALFLYELPKISSYSTSILAQIALFFSMFFSSFQSYYTQKTFVFLSTGTFKEEYFKCLFTWILGYIFNVFVLGILLKLGKSILFINWIKNYYPTLDFPFYWPYIAQFLALIATTIISYILLKNFAFSKKNK